MLGFFFFTQQQYSGNRVQNHGSIVQGYGRDCVTLGRKFPRGTASHRRKSPPLENLPSLQPKREISLYYRPRTFSLY